VSATGSVSVYVENSKSRTGKHRRRRLYFVVREGCRLNELRPSRTVKSTATYADGYAEIHDVVLDQGEFLVHADFRVNLRGHIRGDIVIYDSEGMRICRAVYRKLKVRVVETVDSGVVELIKCVFRKLKLPVKKYGIIQGAVKS
jgi:hypothetical protein